MMTNTELLRAKIQESGLKLSHIAKRLGLTPYGLANKINNRTEFKPSEIELLCEILFIPDTAERFAIFFAKKVDK